MKLLLTGYIPTKYVCSDGGRSESKRPRQSNDCTVRALALACDVSYDAAYDYCAEQGRKCARGFFLNKHLNKLFKQNETIFGHDITKISFPAVKDEERMYVAAFPIFHPEGRYIIRQAKHMAAVIEGNVHDIKWHCFRCVYVAWKIVNTKERKQNESYK